MAKHSFDVEMMQVALRMGQRGLGRTAPNPAVGAVIADEATGEIIGRGWTQPGGRPHAETEAIRRAGERARGATLYVTLEPCAHFGKTPPCADAIIASGLRRVVVGTGDPDPRTAGEGCARLRRAGIEVEENVLGAEARRLTLGHILRLTWKRPFVQLKLALDADGEIARGASGRPVWVTGETARNGGHLLRARADAIAAGIGTILDDNPALTCRLPGMGSRSPRRVILDSRLRVPLDARVLEGAKTGPGVTIVTLPDQGSEKAARLAAMGVDVVSVRPDPASGKISIPGLLEALAHAGITRLLVEGGPSLWAAFGASRLVDEGVLFQARGGGNPETVFARWVPGPAMALAESRRIGDDLCHVLRPE